MWDRQSCNIGQKRKAMVVAGLVRLEGQSTVVGIMCGEAGV